MIADELFACAESSAVARCLFCQICELRGVREPDFWRTCHELHAARLRYAKTKQPQRVTWEDIPWFIWPTDVSAAHSQAVFLMGPLGGA